MDVLVTGSSGFIGSCILQSLADHGGHVHGVDLTSIDNRTDVLDVGDAAALADYLSKNRPAVVVHAAAIKSLMVAERDKAAALQANVLSSEIIREYASKCRAKVVYISSDVVFDGRSGNYSEQSSPNPINWYGRTKRFSEVLFGALPGSAICRTALVIGKLAAAQQRLLVREQSMPVPDTQTILPQFIGERLARGVETGLSRRHISNPTPLELLAMCIRKIVQTDAEGVFHTAGPDAVSRYELGLIVADVVSRPRRLIVDDPTPDLDTLRPKNLSLRTEKTFTALGIDPEQWRLPAVLKRILVE